MFQNNLLSKRPRSRRKTRALLTERAPIISPAFVWKPFSLELPQPSVNRTKIGDNIVNCWIPFLDMPTEPLPLLPKVGFYCPSCLGDSIAIQPKIRIHPNLFNF